MNLLRFAIGLCVAVAVAVVAIGAIGDGGGRFRLKPRSAPTAERDKNPDDPFQRTVADDRGHTMTIPSPPQRIASHEMTLDEILFAVVEESRIVAVSRNAFDTRYSNVAAKVERLGLPMTTAASTGQILILPNNVFPTMAYHVIELVEGMVAALYPEAA